MAGVRLPVTGSDAAIWGDLLDTWLTANIPSDCPENHGTIGQGADAAAINAAIASLQSTGKSGLLVLSQHYTLEAQVTVAGSPPVHFWFANGAMNRQPAIPTFLGARLSPGAGYPINTALVSLGTPGNPTANPNGTLIFNGSINGRDPSGNYISGLAGFLLNDTSDVTFISPKIANCDPTTAGAAISNQGSVSVGAAGLDIIGGVIANCFWGLLGDGLGATDARVTQLLMRNCPKGIDMGPSGAGGGGLQLTGSHIVHGSAGAGNFALQLGTAAGDSIIDGNYFDTYGTANPVVAIAPRNWRMTSNHFLAGGNAAGVMVQASNASQRSICSNNDLDANGSNATALLKLSGKAGAPSNGVIAGNNVYNHTGTLIAAVIDSANVAVPATNTATTYIQGNVAE